MGKKKRTFYFFSFCQNLVELCLELKAGHKLHWGSMIGGSVGGSKVRVFEIMKSLTHKFPSEKYVKIEENQISISFQLSNFNCRYESF